MPIWLSTSRFAPKLDILRTRQSIPEPSNEIVPAFRICCLWAPRFSSRLGMAPSRFTARLASAGANRLEANVHAGRPRAFRKHAPGPDRAMSRESQHRWAIASLLPIELGSLRPKRAGDPRAVPRRAARFVSGRLLALEPADRTLTCGLARLSKRPSGKRHAVVRCP